MFPETKKLGGKIISAGAAINFQLPAVPDKFTIYNLMAAAGEIMKIEWFKDFGNGKDIVTRSLVDNGTTAAKTIEYRSTGGYINTLDASAFQAGSYTNATTYTAAGQNKSQGVTVHADFSDNDDVLYWEAEFNVEFTDGGDIST